MLNQKKIMTFNDIYRDVSDNAKLCSPRGLLVKEIEDYAYTLAPRDRFAAFTSRKLSVNYIKDELLWYLKGDRHDLSISEKAKIWQTVITDGQLNSNYGHYIFKRSLGNIDYAYTLLKNDPDTRRASITILDESHLYLDNRDVPCTYAINFRIRDGVLNASVHMRSQDAVYGMGNDVPAFSFVHEMLCVMLRDGPYPDLVMGPLHVAVDSFHVYERHFEMLEKIKDEPQQAVFCPWISSHDEIEALRAGDVTGAARSFPFSRWLTQKEV